MPTPRRHQPVRANRVLNSRQRYDAIKWNDEQQAIDGFKSQLQDFYVAPTKRLLDDDNGLFMAVALTCVLIDTLAQYEAGASHSSRGLFISWLRTHVPSSAQPLPVRIETRSVPKGITDFAEAVYYGYRCGILHEAHPYMFCGIAGQYRAIKSQDSVFTCRLTDLTRYEDGTACPTVVVDPAKLLDAVLEQFHEYFVLLKSNGPEAHRTLVKFKKKFLESHGIEIGKDH